MTDPYEGKAPEDIKAEWLQILDEDNDDPNEYQTVKVLEDGHQRGDHHHYVQGMRAALKGEGANPAIASHGYHDGWARMVWAMKEYGIEPLPPHSQAVLALPARHRFTT
jgi:hypothetical protein